MIMLNKMENCELNQIMLNYTREYDKKLKLPVHIFEA